MSSRAVISPSFFTPLTNTDLFPLRTPLLLGIHPQREPHIMAIISKITSFTTVAVATVNAGIIKAYEPIMECE